jgi:enterochelin esterase-like enzyme
MLRTRFAGPIAAGVFLVANSAIGGTISHYSFPSETLGRDYAYNIYLPDGYETSGFTYPTLYLLHGSFGNENDWPVKGELQQTADRLIDEGSIPPAVIVMPGSLSWWADGYNEKAEPAFFDDLIPHIEATWRVIPEREGRLVGGLSAGGYGTVNFVLEHPEMFAAGAALSPASYVPQPPSHSSGNRHPAYLKPDGTYDPQMWETLNYPQYIDAYREQDIVAALHQLWRPRHVRYRLSRRGALSGVRKHQPDKVEFRVIDGDHEWPVWVATLPEAMTYVFSYASRPRGVTPTH